MKFTIALLSACALLVAADPASVATGPASTDLGGGGLSSSDPVAYGTVNDRIRDRVRYLQQQRQNEIDEINEMDLNADPLVNPDVDPSAYSEGQSAMYPDVGSSPYSDVGSSSYLDADSSPYSEGDSPSYLDLDPSAYSNGDASLDSSNSEENFSPNTSENSSPDFEENSSPNTSENSSPDSSENAPLPTATVYAIVTQTVVMPAPAPTGYAQPESPYSGADASTSAARHVCRRKKIQ